DGVPAGVPVHRFYPDAATDSFDQKPSRGRTERFYAYQANTLEYRRMVERLNDLTGLLVSTFQAEYAGKSFVVDGARGGELAQIGRKPRPIPREVKPEELRAAAAGAELHLVSIYGAGPGQNGSPVDVEVRPTAKPIVLALASYGSVLWKVKIAKEARVQAV